jgi:hypothetical protein
VLLSGALNADLDRKDHDPYFNLEGIPTTQTGSYFLEYIDNLRRVQSGEPFMSVFNFTEGKMNKVERHANFRMLIGTQCQGRRLGVTARGLLGLFPVGAAEGDEVWLVCGMTTPFAFRRYGKRDEKNLLENIGECYVQGAMYGELWSPHNAEDVVLQ